MKPIGFAALAAGLCMAGVVVASLAGWPVEPTASGVGVAWLVHVSAFVILARSFAAGRGVMTAWAGGMVARMSALLAMWVMFTVGMVGRDVAQAFVFALIVLVLLEALWLSVVTSQVRSTEG